MHAKLIQANEGFNLYNLAEIRFFITRLNTDDDVRVITDDVWENAFRESKANFGESSNRMVCENLLKDFAAVNTKIKYRSDLEVFIRESKLEDLYTRDSETIFVSTIHKAKGKEFDNIFLMLEDIGKETDETLRQLYVAITRAKQNLTIHINTDHFDNIGTDNLERIEYTRQNSPPSQLAQHLTHKDLWLDHFFRT